MSRKVTSDLYVRQIKLANEFAWAATEFPKYCKCTSGGARGDFRWAAQRRHSGGKNRQSSAALVHGPPTALHY